MFEVELDEEGRVLDTGERCLACENNEHVFHHVASNVNGQSCDCPWCVPSTEFNYGGN